jgi:hypothetical protein
MDDEYYNILELSKNASPDAIKKSYRRLSLLYHPDKNFGNIEATNKFVKINEAYEILSKTTNHHQTLSTSSSSATPSSSSTTTTTKSSYTFKDNLSNIMNKEYNKRELQLIICTSIIICIIIYYILTKVFPFISKKIKLRFDKNKTLEILKQKQKDQQNIELLDNLANNPSLSSRKINNDKEKINKFKLTIPLPEKNQFNLKKEKVIIKEIKENNNKSNTNKLRKQAFSLKTPKTSSILNSNSQNLENNSINSNSSNNNQQQPLHQQDSIIQNENRNNIPLQNYSTISNNSTSSHVRINNNDSIIRQQDIDYAAALEIDRNIIEALKQKESMAKIERDLIKEKEVRNYLYFLFIFLFNFKNNNL